MPYCSRCGAKLPEDARFCPKCGTAVSVSEAKLMLKHETIKVTGRPKVIAANRAPGQIVIKAGQTGQVDVDLQLREPEDLEWNISQEGNVVTVKNRALVHPLRWSKYLFSGGPRADIMISVPAESDLDLEAHLDRVDVNGVKGTITVSSSVARVNLKDCEGTIKITGKTGPINLQNVKGTVTISSATGPVDLENVDGTVSVNDRTGAIRFSGALEGENMFSTSTGSIELTLIGKPDLTVEAFSRLGSVKCIPELVDAHYERGRYVGRVGTGKGRIIAEAKVGSITIRQS